MHLVVHDARTGMDRRRPVGLPQVFQPAAGSVPDSAARFCVFKAAFGVITLSRACTVFVARHDQRIDREHGA
jgi:hypothetical protein